VTDGDDACPKQPGPVARSGCPDDDPDRDGVRGAQDQCPAQAEDRDGFRDDDGCPEADNDGDGLLDGDDECPAEAGARATRGCPDGDGDGVGDSADKCPKVAGPPENGGCPKYKAIVVTDTKIELSQKIFFAFGLTTILPRSYPLLDEVVQALTDRPGLCVRIEGHTDAVGSLPKNMALSEGRAQAVKDYLASHGVPAKSLAAKGYGPTLPLDSNATDAGRERNRRVEFVITPCP
jgi:OmpA-OmpF porin, OOP family